MLEMLKMLSEEEMDIILIATDCVVNLQKETAVEEVTALMTEETTVLLEKWEAEAEEGLITVLL
eukprot:gene22546-28679_t